MKKSLIIFFIAASSRLAFGTDYHIDPQNGSMNNDGSFASPWSTLASVMQSKSSLFTGGDSLFLRSGYHGDNVFIGGSPISPIIIIAEQDNEPMLLNFTINGSNWIIDGLSFSQEGNDGVGDAGQFDNGIHLKLGANSRNNVVKKCNFYSTKDASGWSVLNWRNNVWSGIFDHGKGNLIKGNHLFNIAYAIQLAQECDSSIVEANLIESFSGDGIRIGGADYCRVENNIIKNSIELDANPSDGNHEDGIQAWDFDDGVNGLIVRGNYILNYEKLDQPFRGVLQGMGFFDGFYNDCIIENNIIIVEHWHGISLFGAKDCRIINNTVLPNPGGSTNAGPPLIWIDPHKDGRASTGNIIRNNLSTNLSLSGSSTDDHNVIHALAKNFCNDYDNFDFHPKADFSLNGESIIDSGSPDFAPPIDFDGTSRPKGEGFDIGAYEFENSVTSIDESNAKSKLKSYKLRQNYPNPFNPNTTIEYNLPNEKRAGRALLQVFNLNGQLVRTLVDKVQDPGSQVVIWDGKDFRGKSVSSGVYIYRLVFNNFSLRRKMTYLK